MKLKLLKLIATLFELLSFVLTISFCIMGYLFLSYIFVGLCLIGLFFSLSLDYNMAQVDAYIEIRSILLLSNEIDKCDYFYSKMSKLQKWIYNQKKEGM